MITAEEYIMPLGDVVIKARTSGNDRLVEVEASSEAVDAEGDVVMQKALLDAGPEFVKSGHLDIDHYSEIGSRIGIRNPDSYIIGRPKEVKDLGEKRTGVVGVIMRSHDGENPDSNRFDAFWKSLQSDPPVLWRASIYGFPTDVDDCTEKSCFGGATRYVIKAINWRSLAFTRNPINRSLSGYAKMVTAKAAVAAIARGGSILPFGLSGGPECSNAMSEAFSSCPMNMDGLWGQYLRHRGSCPFMSKGNSVSAFRDHFQGCCGTHPENAEILAHALMYAILRDQKRR